MQSGPSRNDRHPKGWAPRVDTETGVVIVRSDDPEPPGDWDEIIRQFKLDPAKWEVLSDSVHVRTWDINVGGGEIQRCYYYKTELRPRRASATDVDEIISRVSKWRPRTVTTGVAEGTYVVPVGDLQLGKALSDDTEILTTSGWKRHGDLRPGDYVYGTDGNPKRVLSVTGSAPMECFRVVFDKGVEIVASGNHLWRGTRPYRIGSRRVKGKRVGGRPVDRELTWTTSEIASLKRHEIRPGYFTTARPFRIDNPSPIELPDADLLVDPYLLGLWLGDGSARAGYITSGFEDAPHLDHLGHRIVPKGHAATIRVPGLTADLRALGVLGDKHVPDEYLMASPKQRIALLQGLMDSDGYCGESGICEFSNTNQQLSESVYWIVTSLGMKVRWSWKFGTLHGEVKSPVFRVQFTPPEHTPVFRLERKLERQRHVPPQHQITRRFVQYVEPVGTRSAQCITLEGSMYLAGRDLVPTHNSDGGGSQGIVDRFLVEMERAAQRLRKRNGRKAAEQVFVPWMGDCIEGLWSQNKSLRMRLDLTATEQVRVYRHLMLAQVKLFAPLTERLVVPVIPGNHDEAVREGGKMASFCDDSWAIEGASAVMAAVNENPELREKVEFVFPGHDQLTLTLDVDGTYVGLAHGHQFPGGADGWRKWWNDQAGGRTPVGMADVLLAAHLHHLRVQDHGDGRLFLQIPALDGGSTWFKHRRGEASPPRVVTFFTKDGHVWGLDPVTTKPEAVA